MYALQSFAQILIIISFFHDFRNSVEAHPIPDLPVFGSFDKNGTAKVTAEVDPRAFSKDPEAVPFLTSNALEEFNVSARQNLLTQSFELIESSLQIRMGHQEWHLPDFQFEFTETENKDENNETIIKIRAFTSVERENHTTYQIRARETASLDLIFANEINGVPQRRVNVLFPGEESFVLPLPPIENNATRNLADEPSREIASSNPAGHAYVADTWSTVASFCRQGFIHVLPMGLDHILFVLGLFLLSRKLKPLLYQVTCFTVAHTITLGMASLGWISVPEQVVEPIIAASIAFVALENIFFPAYHPRRLVVVFFFGLIHGLGFAGALSDLNLDPSVLLLSLVGFNLGVEGGQLAVILLSLVGTYRFKDEKLYRKGIVIPGSVLIAAFGIFWTLERIMNG